MRWKPVIAFIQANAPTDVNQVKAIHLYDWDNTRTYLPPYARLPSSH